MSFKTELINAPELVISMDGWPPIRYKMSTEEVQNWNDMAQSQKDLVVHLIMQALAVVGE